MRKCLLLLLIICVLAVFTACSGNKEHASAEQNLFELASPSSSVITMYRFDGTGSGGTYYDLQEEQKIVDGLNKVRAVPVTDWTPALITYPAYSFEIGTTDGNGYRAFWSNDYLVMRDGTVYKFEYDFGDIYDSHTWNNFIEIKSLAQMPCGRYLAQDAEGWIAANMALSEQEPQNPDYIVAACEEWSADEIRYSFTNTGETEWGFGDDYYFEVLLEGSWYRVPTNCDLNYAFNSILNVLMPGETRNLAVRVSGERTTYSNLPAGHYRLVHGGVAIEGDFR